MQRKNNMVVCSLTKEHGSGVILNGKRLLGATFVVMAVWNGRKITGTEPSFSLPEVDIPTAKVSWCSCNVCGANPNWWINWAMD
jgi:hypothetical protein